MVAGFACARALAGAFAVADVLDDDATAAAVLRLAGSCRLPVAPPLLPLQLPVLLDDLGPLPRPRRLSLALQLALFRKMRAFLTFQEERVRGAAEAQRSEAGKYLEPKELGRVHLRLDGPCQRRQRLRKARPLRRIPAAACTQELHEGLRAAAARWEVATARYGPPAALGHGLNDPHGLWGWDRWTGWGRDTVTTADVDFFGARIPEKKVALA